MGLMSAGVSQAKIYTISASTSGSSVSIDVKNVVPDYDKLTSSNFFVKSVRLNPVTTTYAGDMSLSYNPGSGLLTVSISGGSIIVSREITVVCVVGAKEVQA